MLDLFAHLPVIEPNEGIALTGNSLETSSEYRLEDCVDEALGTGATQGLALQSGKLILKGEPVSRQSSKVLFNRDELAAFGSDMSTTVLLGHTQAGEPRIAVHCNIDLEKLPKGFFATDFRTAYINEYLTRDDAGTLAQGAALMAWNQNNKHCGRCGGTMVMESGGYRRACISCEAKQFPRTDPVVISLAVDEINDRCVMGRSPHFPPGMVSCLAGFVDAGETLENAVRRETKEESGIDVGRVSYYASQPWPSPHTIMIGFYAQAASGDISFDSEELEDCQWYTRERVIEMLATPHGDEEKGFLPPKGAIANLLVRDWAQRD